MGNFLDRLSHKKINRRNFLKASAVGVASLSLPGCSSNTLTKAGADIDAAAINGKGKWITAACWHNCGGRCLNKALVVDGIVTRQKTDDTHTDGPDYPQQRACLRGRSQRQQVFGADRLKYPMKRKHWAPGGGDKSLRGKDEWVRISWDEALDIVASELKKAKEKYGNKSILVAKGPEIMRTMGLYGGFCGYWNTNSFGTWALTPRRVGFQEETFDQTINDRFDLRNCDTVIMLSMNPAWSASGSSSWHYIQAKKAGAKFIGIDPFYNDTYSLLEADWIPTRPSTDTALLLAVAYVLLTEDNPISKPLIDWDFLKRCTIGFDSESMPEGEDPKGNFKDYVLGTYDGKPKTPEWASEICGVKPEKIRYLALEFGKTKKVAFLCGMASARTRNADNLPQLIMTIGAMTGHIGKSGHMTGSTMHATSGNAGPALVKIGSDKLPAIPNPVDDNINANEVWNAVLDGKYNFTGSGGTFAENQYLPGQKRDIDIHVIYHGGAATLQTSDGMAKGIEAHRKVDFVVSHSHFLTTNSMYADIVLPVTTEWEKFGGFMGGALKHTGNREMLINYSKITEPMFECHDDQWIAIEIAKRLGIDEKKVYPFNYKEQYYNILATSTVIKEDGKTYEPLVTITEADLELGVKGTPQKGRISYQEFKDQGVYQVKRQMGDNYGYIGLKKFVEDPEKNPLKSSKSGKMEIYSKTLADQINAMGYSKIKPIPTYIDVVGGYKDTFKDWEKKVKGEYPYQIVNPHYLRRSHSVFDNVQWLREAWTNPVYINSKDASDNGIVDGDTVLITSVFGRILRAACVTERFMPGVIGLPHGAWVDIDEKTGIDTGGADNILSGQVPTGQGTSGFNTGVVKIEKYKGTSLVPDVNKPQRIIF
jgi:anaerobic dimethyl sulfoxide reductase subunit A